MIELTNIELKAGAFHLGPLNFKAEAHSYVAVVGPTGAGKSLTGRIIAGIITPCSGQVTVDGNDITDLAPESRGIGYVPQDYALFPHMTVRKNLAFGLAAKNRSVQEQEEEATRLAAQLEISHLLDRHPANLSGGERQRVALGRAMAVKPGVMILDEPLSAVDESIRLELTRCIADLHRRTGGCFIHVTHNLNEALSLASLVIVMMDGKIAQCDRPIDVLERPNSVAVAEFVQAGNIISGIVTAAAEHTRLQIDRFGELVCKAGEFNPGDRVAAVIRPEFIRVDDPGSSQSCNSSSKNCFKARIAEISRRIDCCALRLDCGINLSAVVSIAEHKDRLQPGMDVQFTIDPAKIHLLSETGS